MELDKSTLEMMCRALLLLADVEVHEVSRDRFLNELMLFNRGGLEELERHLLRRVREAVDDDARSFLDVRNIQSMSQLVRLNPDDFVAGGTGLMTQIERELAPLGLWLGMLEPHYELRRLQMLGTWLSVL